MPWRSMTHPLISQKKSPGIERLPAEPEVPLLEVFWGKDDEAKALFRECQESIARKYGSGSPDPSPTSPRPGSDKLPPARRASRRSPA